MIRGCGRRKPGGVYVMSELGSDGVPLEEVMIDPPTPYEGGPFRAPQLVRKNGFVHLVVWVGAEFYEYPCDYIEETRRLGASRRVPVDFPIEELTRSSMMFFIHGKAIIDNYEVLPPPEYCPKVNEEHLNNDEYCLGHTYQVGPEARRTVGEITYPAFPAKISERLLFSPGVFLRMPITGIDHILKDGEADPRVKAKREKMTIPVNYKTE
jgi:hypothetical protein